MKVVVSDTSPLFYLSRIGRLGLLQDLYRSIVVPETVWSEALAAEAAYPGVAMMLREAHVGGWIDIRAADNLPSLAGKLDPGETAAISLACEIRADLLIIDEKLGREAAKQMGLSVCGTLGVLVAARRQGLIGSIASELQRLRSETSFRFTPELEHFVLKQVGEA